MEWCVHARMHASVCVCECVRVRTCVCRCASVRGGPAVICAPHQRGGSNDDQRVHRVVVEVERASTSGSTHGHTLSLGRLLVLFLLFLRTSCACAGCGVVQGCIWVLECKAHV